MLVMKLPLLTVANKILYIEKFLKSIENLTFHTGFNIGRCSI